MLIFVNAVETQIQMLMKRPLPDLRQALEETTRTFHPSQRRVVLVAA
jgi:hypothetical protein